MPSVLRLRAGQFVLNDSEAKNAIDAGNLVTLKADGTKPNREAYNLMNTLGHEARTFPFFALFDATAPDRPRT